MELLAYLPLQMSLTTRIFKEIIKKELPLTLELIL
jgi:hypothetical protein